MKVILLLGLIGIGYQAIAQENRSAKELATENIKDYVENKLFTGNSYNPQAFGELKKYVASSKTIITWTIEHDFVLIEKRNGRSEEIHYGFIFYLDRKMNVHLAERYDSGK